MDVSDKETIVMDEVVHVSMIGAKPLPVQENETAEPTQTGEEGFIIFSWIVKCFDSGVDVSDEVTIVIDEVPHVSKAKKTKFAEDLDAIFGD